MVLITKTVQQCSGRIINQVLSLKNSSELCFLLCMQYFAFANSAHQYTRIQSKNKEKGMNQYTLSEALGRLHISQLWTDFANLFTSFFFVEKIELSF